ncbi:MAG: glycosyltransferase [Bacillaceae bacterium]|nr:glycosyltransferase [Bacillaceae bacterium]
MTKIAGDQKHQLKIHGIDYYVPKTEIDAAYLQEQWLAGVALFPPTEHYFKKELTKFFEYMTAGIPILCSNFPAWEAFVKKYNCGIAVDPFDDGAIVKAIQYLRNNKSEAVKMGNNGRRAVVDRLNWETEGRKLVDLYHRLGTNKT